MNEEHELPYVMVSTDYNKKVEAEVRRQRGFFINDFLEKQKTKLGNEEFMKQQAKLSEEAGKHFDLAHEGKMEFFRLEEQSGIELMNWKDLEKALRQWLENEGHASELIEKSVENHKAQFEIRQAQIKHRIAAAKYDPDADFRKRVLDTKTREQALKEFLFGRAGSEHFQIEVLMLLFELLEKKK